MGESDIFAAYLENLAARFPSQVIHDRVCCIHFIDLVNGRRWDRESPIGPDAASPEEALATFRVGFEQEIIQGRSRGTLHWRTFPALVPQENGCVRTYARAALESAAD